MPFAKEALLTLVEYNAWANRCFLDACLALTAEEFHRPAGVSHQSIAGTLRQLYDAERFWFHRLRERSLPPLAEIGEFGPTPISRPSSPRFAPTANRSASRPGACCCTH